MIIVAAIHGILTGQTSASWPDEFDAWASRQAKPLHVIKKEYSAGPFPRLNALKNRRLARGLVEEIALLHWTNEDQVWLVAHSNGAVIALMAARELIARGITVDGMILTGAACGSDVEQTGVLQWVRDGMLGCAIAFSSASDGVVNTRGLWRWLKWPYGDLGRVGWRRNGQPYQEPQIFTRWFAGGHSGYFGLGRKAGTFEAFYREITGAKKGVVL